MSIPLGGGLPIDRRQQIWRQITAINRELDYIDAINPKFSIRPSKREIELMAARRELRRELRILSDT
jgi:hypothetical protein